MTRGKGERDNGGKKGKSCQGPCRKNPWTKPKGGKTEGGKWGWVGGGGKVVAGKWRPLYMNNNKKTI